MDSAVSELDMLLPWERIDAARVVGRPVLYFSLGTVATKNFWKIPLGKFADGNDDLPHESRPLGAHTGIDFCQHVWRTFFEAFGSEEDAKDSSVRTSPLVIMTLGSEPDALEGMPS